jgi:formamidopyrimidine-DNA glycosylase
MLVGKRDKLLRHKDILSLALDPFQISSDALLSALKKRSISIKQALLDQKIISGIGNIYADEILWATKIYPLMPARLLKEFHVRDILLAGRRIMKKSIEKGGTSMRDFRNTKGEKGGYLALCKVYGREGEKCLRNGSCVGIVERIVIGTRSARFCPKCQK